jgi:hypothetical protein
MQVWLPQLTFVLACWQAPAPLHTPVLPQGGLAVQPPCGSAPPGATLAQVPALPETLQAWQLLQVEVPQQTPSTQKFPVRQSVVAVQACPRRFLLPQRLVLGSQMFGARHWLSIVQAALQAVVPLQANGAQGLVVAARQVPLPSQVRAFVSVAMLGGHDGATHWVPAP